MPTTISGNSITTGSMDLTTPLTEVDGGTGSSSAYKMGMGTAVASTSGTSIDFTGIPSWAKRITVMFNGVSTNGASLPTIRIGTSGGIEVSGYTGSMFVSSGTTVVNSLISSGIPLHSANNATDTYAGMLAITLLGANTYILIASIGGILATRTTIISGSKTLSATLDRIRITTENGTDTFDAGSINIMWEGV